MGQPVNPPSEPSAGLSVRAFRDPSTTRQTLLLPSGALSLLVEYILLPGATAVTNQAMRVVLNATTDADANGRLATTDAYLLIFQGRERQLSADSSAPITRVDFLTEQAVGAEKTILQFVAGVRT